MTRRTLAATAIAIALVSLAVSSQVIVATSGDVKDAREDQRIAEESRDAIRGDVAKQEERLAAYEDSLGWDPTPVLDEPVELPKGVSANILTGDLAVGDFEDVFVDEGIVLRGVSAEEVDEIPLQDVDTYPPKPQPPLKVRPGKRLVHLKFEVRNRIGDAADPGCGFGDSIANHAFDDTGEPVPMSKAYEDAATYLTACGDGIADGAAAPMAFAVELDKGRKLAALQFSLLGEESDSLTQTLVFRKPV